MHEISYANILKFIDPKDTLFLLHYLSSRNNYAVKIN